MGFLRRVREKKIINVRRSIKKSYFSRDNSKSYDEKSMFRKRHKT